MTQRMYGHFAAIEMFEKLHHFAGRGDVFAPFGRCLEIHHFAAELGVRQADALCQAEDVFHADAVDQDVGCGIVTDRDHDRGEVAVGECSDSWGQAAHDAAVRHEVRGAYHVGIGELRLARRTCGGLLGLVVEFREHGN